MGRERADGDRVCIEPRRYFTSQCIEKDAIPRDRVSIGKHSFSGDREGQNVSCEGRYFYVTEGGRACT